MKLVELLPWVAGAVAFVTFTLIARGTMSTVRQVWIFPGILSVLFFAWSFSALIIEGPTGFWTEHTRNMWGNQIWFDLLIAVGIAWYLIIPRAKKLGMSNLLWLSIIVCTGCIGLLAMLALILFLENQEKRIKSG